MPTRIHPSSKAIASTLRCKPLRTRREHATAAAVITPAASDDQMTQSAPPIARYPKTQPPSFKPPEFRKSQLLRSYTSLLRSTPLMLLFQHNNLRSSEWMSIRRELAIALRRLDESLVAQGIPSQGLADGIKLQIIQTGIFDTALKIVEWYPQDSAGNPDLHKGGAFMHTLSTPVHDAVTKYKPLHGLTPLLSGPLALLTFPTVSPQYLKAALSILSPSQPQFPAPTRKASPGWHDIAVQLGLQKLLLLGARVEGKVFDVEGTKWVGSIDGGIDGLRAQVVALLQSIGGGLTNTLEGAGKSLYLTVEGRRSMLEEEQKGPEETKQLL